MEWIKRTYGKLAKSSVQAMMYTGKHPMETIEILLAFFLLLFGLYVMIPQEFLPTTSVYQNNLVKMIFGGLMAAPAVSLLYHRYSGDMESYIYTKQKKRRKSLFWISFTWFYMTILRISALPILPPIFLAFLCIALISIICYIRLIK